MNKTLIVSLCCSFLLLVNSCGLKTASDLSSTPISTLSLVHDDAKARVLDEQGDALFLSGDYAQSAGLYQQALALREKSLGKDDLTVIQSLYDLATVHEANGEYVSAIKLYRRAYSIAKKHSDVADIHAKTIQGFIAVLFEARGMIGQSKNSAHQSASAYKRFTKGKHSFYGIVLHKLAGFYSQENNIERASHNFQEAIAAIEQNMGKDHPYLAMVLEDYAHFSRNNNIESDSILLEERAAKIWEHYPKKRRCSIYRRRIAKLDS